MSLDASIPVLLMSMAVPQHAADSRAQAHNKNYCHRVLCAACSRPTRIALHAGKAAAYIDENSLHEGHPPKDKGIQAATEAASKVPQELRPTMLKLRKRVQHLQGHARPRAGRMQ